jgi:hypothetical protein
MLSLKRIQKYDLFIELQTIRVKKIKIVGKLPNFGTDENRSSKIGYALTFLILNIYHVNSGAFSTVGLCASCG